MVSVHTSPLDQPGTGDAGGMNVYVVELSRRLAALGVEVDVITRATSSDLPPAVELAPGRHRPARHGGPVRGPGQGGPAGPAVRLHLRADARRGRPRARLVRPGALPLLALRPGRLAGRRAVGRAAGPLDAHHGQGQEPDAGRRRPPRARGARDRRGPGRGRRRPAGGQHRRGGRPARRAVRRRPGPGRDRPAGGRPRRVLARVAAACPPAARAAGGRLRPALRRPDPAAQGTGRAAAGRRAAARAGAVPA